MEPENVQQESENKLILNKVTSFSKYFALILFIILPFVGGWIGYTYAPEKIVEVEKIVIKKVEIEPLNSEESSKDVENTTGDNRDVDSCDQYWTEAVKGMTADEKLECEKLWSVPNSDGYSRFSYHPQQITLEGEYVKLFFSDKDKYWYLSNSLHFIPNANELYKLPDSDYTPDNGQINFRDVEKVENKFAVPSQLNSSYTQNFCTISGKASITVSEIIIDNFEGDIPLSFRIDARLDEIVEKEPFEVNCD